MSTGSKRTLAGGLSAVSAVASVVPGAEVASLGLDMAAGTVGTVGIAHAGVLGTLKKNKTASIAALFSILTFAAHVYPPLAVILPFASKLAGLFGAAAVGAKLANN